jgi:glycosyltransferase involved in cell wall biosynthesis
LPHPKIPKEVETIKLLVDGREFSAGKQTGIARFLENLLFCVISSRPDIKILLACGGNAVLPPRLINRENIFEVNLNGGYLKSERILSKMSAQGSNLFISPYPKLPLFGTYCPAINTVHDVLYITLPLYQNFLRRHFDLFRLKTAIHQADLTWFHSNASLEETRNLVERIGRRSCVRYPGIADMFHHDNATLDDDPLKQYDLQPGYILCLGNGLPHKNLGVLLKLKDILDCRLVFVGVSAENQKYWLRSHKTDGVGWIDHVPDNHLPVLIKNAFCTAQPSLAEGFGYPPLEAMACGVPSVVSDIPVLAETTGGCSLRADPHEPAAWFQAFKALENADTRKSLVTKGLQWVAPMQGPTGWNKHIVDIAQIVDL